MFGILIFNFLCKRNINYQPCNRAAGRGLIQFLTRYTRAKLPSSGHYVAWTGVCKAGFGSKEHKADYAGPLTETVIMGNLGIRSYNLREDRTDGGRGYNYPGRKKLLWDGENMRVTNFEPANQFVKRDYRGDWKLGS